MPPVMKEVFSSNVSSVGYDAEKKELYVTWSGGKTSVYEDVPPDVGEQAQTSWSVGTFLRQNVRDQFKHRYA